MKKILAIAMAVMLTVALCISASAQTSLDRLAPGKNVLQEMGATAASFLDAEDGALHIEVGTKVYILGWAINKDTSSTLKEVVWTCDGKEMKCDDNYRDRADVAGAIGVASELGVHAGIGHDDNAFELTGMDKLKDGTYAIELKALYNDGTEEILGNAAGQFTLIVGTGVAAEEPAEQPGENPPSGDVAIIAIAAVGCVALAGVVVAKKVK